MPVSKAHIKATNKWMARGESVNGFINRAISETMERDGAAPGGAEGPEKDKEKTGG